MTEVLDQATNSVPAPAPAAEEEEGEEFVVEKIINHRYTKKGKLEYFLKWKGFTDLDNTWEPAENLNCPDLVEIYEAEKEAKKSKKSTPASSSTKTTKVKVSGGDEKNAKGKKRKSTTDEMNAAREKQKKSDKQNGFDRGLTAEEIIGAMENNGEVHFLIKWKEPSQDYELIPSRIVNIKIPQMVIAFYEARLTWSTASSSQEVEEADDDGKKNEAEEEENGKQTEESSTLNGTTDNGNDKEQAPDEASAPS